MHEQLHDLHELRSGSTGRPAYPGGQLEELREQQRHAPLDASGPLARAAAQAYRAVLGPRRECEQHEPSRPSTYL